MWLESERTLTSAPANGSNTYDCAPSAARSRLQHPPVDRRVECDHCDRCPRCHDGGGEGRMAGRVNLAVWGDDTDPRRRPPPAPALPQLVYFGYAGVSAGRDRLWAWAAGPAYLGSLRAAQAGAKSGTAAAPSGFPSAVGLGDAPPYFPCFTDATVAPPCATCCACCVVADPLSPTERLGLPGPGDAGAAKHSDLSQAGAAPEAAAIYV